MQVGPMDELPDELVAMLDNIRAVKGESFFKVIASIFSCTNIINSLLNQIDITDDKKQVLGMTYSHLSMQMMEGYFLESKRHFVLGLTHDAKEKVIRQEMEDMCKTLDSLTTKMHEVLGQ